MEQHRITTKFGLIDVRVYRLKHGWWPVVIGGRKQLPADPMFDGQELSTSVTAALQRCSDAIDAMTGERPDVIADADELHRGEDRTPEAAAAPVRASQADQRLEEA